jgi:DNA-binding transcriptional MocR family regulator
MAEPLRATQFVRRSGLIELAWGQPDSALLPVEDVRRAAAQALEQSGPEALAYGAERGAGPLVEWLRARIQRAEGRALTADEIVITGGVTEALDQVCTLHTRPGDLALIEAPTYHMGMRVLRDHPLELMSVPMDDEGLRVDALKRALADLKRAGRRPRLLYTIPTFHNPTGVCLSAERRRALVEVAVDENLLIVEDDVYRELAYDAPSPPSLWSLAPRGVVARMGSFAKSLAPGLRVGWITAEAGFVGRIVDSGVRSSGGGVNHFAAMTAAAFCAEGFFDEQVARLRSAYGLRRDALSGALAEHLPPGCAWQTPGGGFFIWLKLPEGADALALLPRAEANGVTYVPGARFFLDGAGETILRLAFSAYGPDELAEGARRLGQALHDYLR